MNRPAHDEPRPRTGPAYDLDRAFSSVERSLSHLARLARPSRIFGEVTDTDGHPIDRAAYSVLARVEEFGPIRLTDLANAMEIDISTASRHVRALEQRGLVIRSDAPGDQRASLLRLTDDGEAVLSRSRALRLAGIRTRMSGWTDRDLCTFSRLLERFATGLSGPYDPVAAAIAHLESTQPTTTKEPAQQ